MKTKLSRVLAVLLCIVFIFPQITFASDWTEFGGSPYRHRLATDPIGPPVQLNWMHSTGRSMRQPLLIGDIIYHLGGNKLWTLDAKAEGEAIVLNSIRASDEPSHSDPTWDGRGVYYGTGADTDGTYFLAYYNPATGDAFKVPLSDEIVTAPLVLENDTVIVATADGNIHVVRGLSVDEGTKRSFKEGTGRISSSAGKLGPNSFVIGFDTNCRVSAYQVRTDAEGNPILEKIWADPTPTGVPASITVDGNRIFFSDKNGSFYCVNSTNGDLIWENTDFRGNFINDSPAISSTGVFFSIRNYGGKGLLVRLNKETGVTEWSTKLQAMGANSPLVWQKAGAVLIGDQDGRVCAFNGATGKPLEFAAYQAPTPDGGFELQRATTFKPLNSNIAGPVQVNVTLTGSGYNRYHPYF
ncbi:MAG: PQQ-binding-like beta-propeller repeat protein [Bacillota bacterium]